MDRVHQRFLTHFVEQDVVGHMEADLDGAPLDLGRLRVAIAFADLAGYTRLTEEAGEEEAVDAVERFIEDVEVTLPEGARVIKTIGDEVMIVGSDAAALVDWAVGFQRLVADRRPLPRIGLHYGPTLYRDGDYYGREVNLAARVAARAAGGEVLVTRPGGRARRAPPRVRAHRRGAPEGLRPLRPSCSSRGPRATMADELLDACGPPACCPPGPASSCCSPAGATPSACSTSPSSWAARRARCTSTTACARRPTTTRRTAARCASASGSRSRCTARRGPRTPPATCRRGRATCATRAAAARPAAALVAVGHTASDQAETVLYRLAASPGRRALLGMRPRSGHLVRPLLTVTREETGAWCRARGLAWRDDATNASEEFARGRVRHGLLAALEAVDPRAAANVVRTAELLREEAEVLDVVVDTALAGRDRIALLYLADLPPALARLIVRRLAEAATGGLCARAPGAWTTSWRSGSDGALDVGDGARAVVSGGVLHFEATPPLPASS